MLEQKLWLYGQQIKLQIEREISAAVNELATFRQQGAVMEWRSSRLLPFSVAAARTAVWQCRKARISATKLDLVSLGSLAQSAVVDEADCSRSFLSSGFTGRRCQQSRVQAGGRALSVQSARDHASDSRCLPPVLKQTPHCSRLGRRVRLVHRAENAMPSHGRERLDDSAARHL